MPEKLARRRGFSQHTKEHFSLAKTSLNLTLPGTIMVGTVPSIALSLVLCGPSRTLAQHRRLLENDEFSNLAKELPLARAITGQHIDKTTMVRLALSYIKLHKVIPILTPNIFDYDHHWASSLLELMDCFLMVLDPQGDVLYVSETISIYLGLSQVFCSSCVLSEMCSIRVKSSLTKRANKKDSLRASPGFKVLQMDMTCYGGCRLVVCSPLPSPILSSVSIRPTSFVISTTIDLSIVYLDARAEEVFRDLLSCTASNLKGVSFYSIVHVNDAEVVRKMHTEVSRLESYRPAIYRMIAIPRQRTFYVESNVFRYTSQSNKT
ncbi:PAS domain-containing protein, partial [Trichostrongylus colubriformis]